MCQELHRLFQGMLRRRSEVQHIALTCPIETAASLGCEEDHPEESRIGALPSLRRVPRPQEFVAEVQVPLNDGSDFIDHLPCGNQDVGVTVGLELGDGAAENVIEDTQGLWTASGRI